MAKVHGSLARAGKVKNQTPKVDPQKNTEKEKTGRAKKRYLCNCRYESLKTGQDPMKMKLNSIDKQQQVVAQKKEHAALIAEKKALKRAPTKV